MLFELAVLALVVFLVLYAAHWKHYISIPNKAPALRQFLPHMLFRIPFLVETHFLTNKLALYNYASKNKVKFFSSTGFRDTVYYTANPEDVKIMTLRKATLFPKPYEYYQALRIYGDNILTIPDLIDWKKHRLLCNPAFGEKHLRFLVQKTVESFNLMDKIRWMPQLKKDRFEWEPHHDIVDVTLDIIGKVGFGYDLSVIEHSDSYDKTKHKMSFREALDITVLWGLIVNQFFPDWLAKSFVFSKLNTAADEVSKYMDEIIHNKNRTNALDLLSLLTTLNEQDAAELQDGSLEEVPAGDIKSSSLANTKLTIDEIKSDTYIFLIAGHETSATQLLWTIFEIAKKPYIQDKIYEEVCSVIPGDTEPAYNDYDSLKYTTQVVLESLRFHPPVGFIPKMAAEDVQLSGHTVPKGAFINILTDVMHKDADFWENPLVFDPDHFADMKKVNPMAFVPFSAGPRKCIGSQFSMVESVVILAMLVRNYKIILPPGSKETLEEIYGVTYKPENYKVILERRK